MGWSVAEPDGRAIKHELETKFSLTCDSIYKNIRFESPRADVGLVKPIGQIQIDFLELVFIATLLERFLSAIKYFACVLTNSETAQRCGA